MRLLRSEGVERSADHLMKLEQSRTPILFLGYLNLRLKLQVNGFLNSNKKTGGGVRYEIKKFNSLKECLSREIIIFKKIFYE